MTRRTGAYRSDEWLAMRAKHYEHPYNKFCLVCGSTKRLNVHHRIYRPVRGKTRQQAIGLAELPGDMITLCRKHHKQLHDDFAIVRNPHRKTVLMRITELDAFTDYWVSLVQDPAVLVKYRRFGGRAY